MEKKLKVWRIFMVTGKLAQAVLRMIFEIDHSCLTNKLCTIIMFLPWLSHYLLTQRSKPGDVS